MLSDRPDDFRFGKARSRSAPTPPRTPKIGTALGASVTFPHLPRWPHSCPICWQGTCLRPMRVLLCLLGGRPGFGPRFIG